MRIRSDSLSDQGKLRSRNEDAIYSDRQMGLFMLADGMGGHPAGDVASQMTLSWLAERLTPMLPLHTDAELKSLLSQYILDCHQAIIQAGQSNPQWRGMGTTLVLLYCRDMRAHIANIGDSRAYLFHQQALSQCSQDDNLGPSGSPLSHILTQAIGQPETPNVNHFIISLSPGDKVLLCSDGLTNMLSNTQIESYLDEPVSPTETCRRLVDAANDNGGKDNISVIVAEIDS